jgi:hypothetical protein
MLHLTTAPMPFLMGMHKSLVPQAARLVRATCLASWARARPIAI